MPSTDSAHPKKADGMLRIQWTTCSGFGGRLAPDSLADMDRITHRERRGLLKKDSSSIEVKWQKVEDEWKQSKQTGRRNRYEEFLDLFFDTLKAGKLSFGYLFVKSIDYRRVEREFLAKQPDSKHNYFFMLYFEFLYHCFIRTQVKQQPCQIYIDSRNMGGEGNEYDINKLKEILNRRLFRDLSPRDQPALSVDFQRHMAESILIVDLAESSQEPLVQLSDLCAGCVRYVLEHQLQVPHPPNQPPLFDEQSTQDNTSPGRSELARYFYSNLRLIDRYRGINLLKVSYHHRFSIFPFEFRN